MRGRILGLFLALSLMVTLMAGCGSAMSSKSETTAAAPSMDQGAYDIDVKFSEAMEMETPADAPMATSNTATGEAGTADSLVGGGSGTVNVTNAILAERKIIRSANLTIEVENFDKAYANIEGIIANIGFVQQKNINTERVYVGEDVKLVKSGTIVLRIDKAMFESVLSKLRGIGEVYNDTIDGQDVTDQVVDIESRLRLLKMEQEKLEAYIAKLNDMDQIFKAESKLTEIMYQIESLTGNLNKLNSLVDLATISLNLNEKSPVAEPKPETYGERLLNTMKESLVQAVEFLGDLLVFLIAALPTLIFIGLCVLFVLWIYRKTAKKRKNAGPYMNGSSYPPTPVTYTQPAPPAQGGNQSAQGGAPAQEMPKQSDKQDGRQQ